MATNNVARDYLVGTVLVLIVLAVSFLLIRVLNGVVEEEVRAPERIGMEDAGLGGLKAPAALARDLRPLS